MVSPHTRNHQNQKRNSTLVSVLAVDIQALGEANTNEQKPHRFRIMKLASLLKVRNNE